MRSERGKKTILLLRRLLPHTRLDRSTAWSRNSNSLDNQRRRRKPTSRAKLMRSWKLVRTRYDDGGYSGGSMDQASPRRLLDDVRAHRIRC